MEIRAAKAVRIFRWDVCENTFTIRSANLIYIYIYIYKGIYVFRNCTLARSNKLQHSPICVVSMYELSTLAKKLLKILANFIPNSAAILARFPANLNKFDGGS